MFLVNELGASLTVAGLFYLTSAAAPVVGYVIGQLSDRRSNRLMLFRVCTAAGAIGWVAMALSTRVWMPFVIAVVALSVAGAAGAQIFAAVRDVLSRRPTGADNRVISTIRMAFTAGWIVGPVLGSWAGGQFGLRAMLFGAAACTLSQLLPLGRMRVERYVAPGADLRPALGLNRRMAPLFVFAGLCVLAISGDTVKFAFLPLYLEQDLHASPEVRGAVIAVQPLMELALMPLAGLLADRIGPMRVVIAGAVLGVAANVGYASSDTVVGLFVAQLLMAGLWAVVASLGVVVAQQLYPQGVGLASTIFLSALIFASTFGGLIGGLGVSRLGLPHVFYVPAALCALAAVGMVVLAPRLRGPART